MFSFFSTDYEEGILIILIIALKQGMSRTLLADPTRMRQNFV